MALQHDQLWLDRQAQITLARLLPILDDIIEDPDERQVFIARLREQFPRLFSLLFQLYGVHYDFYYHLQQMIQVAAQHFNDRPPDLKQLDELREANHTWFQSEKMVGAMLYVDLFAGDFAGLREKIPYLQELGITYLHLMPLFRAPADNSDGGYAVSSYRHTNPVFGDMEDLRQLAADFREAGISLCVDFIFNHTSNEHTWALRARAGEERFREFYRIFPDRNLPDQYEQNLREIFPEQAPGNFTWNSELNGWVWTTFYNFQWDLNYDNPEVFTAMMGEMLFLANVGVEILRLDAVAFVWKRLGTSCENLPEAHMIIRALNALVQVAAPAMLFKSEAIVHPDDVNRYIDWQECPISYNPTLMAMIWESLATRRVDPLTYAMSFRYDLPLDCAWVNYVRVHDDIGWSFANDDMAYFRINAFDHRLFLNAFYTGQFPGSYAIGLGFNYNPINQDMRICGTAASLTGIEQAIDTADPTLYRHAIDRHIMIHSIVLALAGIPLLYIGDELATTNDYSYEKDPTKANDSRWVHRPTFDWDRAESRHDTSTPQGEVFTRLTQMIAARKSLPALGGTSTTFVKTGNPHVLAFIRGGTVLCLFNFSDDSQVIPTDVLTSHWRIPKRVVNAITREDVSLASDLHLGPLASLWLMDAKYLPE
jgi:amylosucrase